MSNTFSANEVNQAIRKTTDERELCFWLLYSVFEQDAFSNLVIKQSENITDFVRAMFYGTITYCYSLDFLIKHASKKDVCDMDPSVRTIVRMGTWQIICSEKVPDFAAANTSVELSKKLLHSGTEFINAVLRKVTELSVEERKLSNYKAEVETALKPEIFGIFKKAYGKDRALSIGRAFLKTPELNFRVQTNKTSTELVKNHLEAEGMSVVEGHFMDEALNVNPNGVAISETTDFLEGNIFVQGEAEQLAGFIATPFAGMSVLDCCAAPGGKSTHIAEITGDNCEIVSVDINESRLALINDNAKRLGIKSITTICADAADLSSCDDLSLRKDTNGFDLVVTDVPCSGLGLISKKPDIRQTISFERIGEIVLKQQKIINEAANFVKPGGTLLYSTCTINPSENEKQIEVFLSSHPDFCSEDISDLLPQRLIIDENRQTSIRNGYITLFPDYDLCDGFFIARLHRKV